MPTMHDLPVSHFDGHSNLTQAQKNGSDPTLAEQMAYIYDDVSALESEVAAINLRTGHPEIAALRVAGGTLSANGAENFTLLGTAFLQGQTFATVTIGASLAITAEEPGVAGNSINVEVVDTGGAGPATVAYAAGTLTIDQVGSASDEDTLAALINVTGQTWTGVLRATSGAGGAVAVTASTPLAGGAGAGVTVYAGAGTCGWTGQVGGITDSDATASVQDTILYVNPPDMTALVPALAAADVASVWVDSNEMTTRVVSVVLA